MTSRLREAVGSLISWGTAKATAISSSVKDVVATLAGDGEDEVVEDVVLNHVAAVLFRPQPPSADGTGLEMLFVREGDERITIATRDTRWQVDLEEGEVVVRAFGSSAALLRVRANGDIVLAGNVLHGADTAAEAVVLGTTLKGYLDGLKIWADTHTHPFTPTGPSPTASPTVPSPTVPAIESTKHKVDA